MSKIHDRSYYDAQFNLRCRHTNYQQYYNQYERESEQVRSSLPCRLNIAFGDKAEQMADIFLSPQPEAPVLLFIHGGYWQSLDKNQFSFVAEPFVSAGCTVVLNNYTLSPMANMDQIVRQNREAIIWIYRNASTFNGDPSRIFVSGHSAGGHLVAMLMATDWTAESGLPANVVKGGCAISGIFDLQPVRLSYLNDLVGMDEEVAHRNSPLYHLPKGSGTLIIAVGTEETDEFLHQSAKFAAALNAVGYPHKQMVLPNLNHYAIVQELSNANSPLTQAIFKLMSVSPTTGS